MAKKQEERKPSALEREEMKMQVLLEFLKKYKSVIRTPDFLKSALEESEKENNSQNIIDVSGQTQKIPNSIPIVVEPAPPAPIKKTTLPKPNPQPKKEEPKPIAYIHYDYIPDWKNWQIFGCTDLQFMSQMQQDFYADFKAHFLRGDYIDLKENRAYAACLMYELIREIGDDYYSTNENLGSLLQLTEVYPYLREIVQETIRSAKKRQHHYWSYSLRWYNLDNYSELSISAEQEDWLQYIPQNHSNFCRVDACCIEVLRVFLLTMAQLENIYYKLSNPLSGHINQLGDIIARKRYRFRNGSFNYKNTLGETRRNFHAIIFYSVDNALRQLYQFPLKQLSKDFDDMGITDLKLPFQELRTRLKHAIDFALTKAKPLSEEADCQLNGLGTSRWHLLLDELKAAYDGNSAAFAEAIKQLAQRNMALAAVEGIFTESARLLAGDSKKEALTLYAHYLHEATKPNERGFFDTGKTYKAVAKKLLKNLLPTKELLESYEAICERLKSSKGDKSIFEEALAEIEGLFVVKRKKIEINQQSIAGIQSKHSATVDLLNQYLQEEEEAPCPSPKKAEQPAPTPQEEKKPKKTAAEKNETPSEKAAKKAETQAAKFLPELGLNQPQSALLQVFSENGYRLSIAQVDTFAKMQGLMRAPLIEAINEACYEIIDDLLIEDEGGDYAINPTYYAQLAMG